MKLLNVLAAASLSLATGSMACIRVHAQITRNYIIGDTMQVQIWDNEHFVCRTGDTKRGTSDNTVWNVSCSGPNSAYPYDVELRAAGKQGRVTHKVAEGDVWSADLHLKETKPGKNCLWQTDTGLCRSWETMVESCLNDNFGNCGSYNCPLCDFRGWCPT